MSFLRKLFKRDSSDTDDDSPIVRMGEATEGELLLRRSAEPSDQMELHVFASADGAQAKLVATLDNLGKGAASSAIQNMNCMLGLPEDAGIKGVGLHP